MTTAPLGRVLVVDDDQDNAVSIGMLLRAKGYEAKWCHDCDSCFDAVAEWHPDVILLDIGMPGITGFEIASTLRKRPELQSMAIIALTGYSAASVKAEGSVDDFDAYLLKPVAWVDLEAVLKAAVGARDK
jgi:CheY-like chemotaxis protein